MALKRSTAVILAALLTIFTPVANAADAPAAAQPSNDGDDTTITVMAHRRYTIESAKSEISASDPHFSCFFNHDYSTKGYKRPLTPPDRQIQILRNPSASPEQNGAWESMQLKAQSRDGGRGEEDFCNDLARSRLGKQLLNDKDMPAAYAAYEAKDYAKALPLFIAAYNKLGIVTEDNPSNVQRRTGLPFLAVMAGRMYLLGQGTDRDVNKAIEWFKKAALQTYDNTQVKTGVATKPEFMSSQAEAAMALAEIYGTGFGVPVDKAEARRWYIRAAELEYYPAFQICGLIFESGYGGPANPAKAVDYFTQAATAGYVPSQYTVGELYYLGADGVKQDKMRGGAWLLKAAQAGYPDALYAVGQMYDLGEGGATVDPVKALVYYKEAAVKGQPDAENAVGLSFYTGDGVPKDLPIARLWFLKASKDANPDAMFNLAVMLINGEGGDKDYVQAWVWLKIAIAGSHPKAAAALVELEAKMTPDEKAKAQALFQPAPAQ